MAYRGKTGVSTTLLNIKKEGAFKEKLKSNTPSCEECMFFKFKKFKCNRLKRSKQKELKKCDKFMFKSNTNISF